MSSHASRSATKPTKWYRSLGLGLNVNIEDADAAPGSRDVSSVLTTAGFQGPRPGRSFENVATSKKSESGALS